VTGAIAAAANPPSWDNQLETFRGIKKEIYLKFFPPNGPDQGCQMVCFQTKNPNLGKFWRALD
jgi:hypothetical protein